MKFDKKQIFARTHFINIILAYEHKNSHYHSLIIIHTRMTQLVRPTV